MTRHQPVHRHVRRSPHALIFRNPQETPEDRDTNMQQEIREAVRRNDHLRPIRGSHAMILTPTSTTFDSTDTDLRHIFDEKATMASVLPAISSGIALFGGSFFRGLLGALTQRRSSTSSSVGSSDESSDRGTSNSTCGDDPQFQSVDECCTCAFADMCGEDEAPFSENDYDPNVMIVVRYSRFRPCPIEGHDSGFSKVSTPGAWPESAKAPTTTTMTMSTASFFSPLVQKGPDVDLAQPGTTEMTTETTAPIRVLRGPQALGPCSGDDQVEEEEGEDLSQGWMHLTWD